MALAVFICTLAWAAPAMGNALKPGVNEDIGFSSFREFPNEFPGVIVEPTGESFVCGDELNPDDGIFWDLLPFSRCGEELFSMRPDGSGQTRVTDNGASPRLDGKYSWNPVSGGGIAYESNVGCEQYEEFWEDLEDELCLQDVYTANADGSNPVQRTVHPARDVHPSWSPDGTKIAFESGRPLYELLQVLRDRKGIFEDGEQINIRGIYTMPSSGETESAPAAKLPDPEIDEDLFRLWADMTPVYSPDGSQIAFTRFQFLVSEGGLQLPPDLLDSVDGLLNSDGTPDVEALLKATPSLVPITDFLAFGMQTYTAPSDGSAPAQPLGAQDLCVILESEETDRLGIDDDGCNLDRHPAYTADGSRILVDRVDVNEDLRVGDSIERTEKGFPLFLLDRDIVSINSSNAGDQVNLSDVTEDPECEFGFARAGGEELCREDAKPAPSPDGTKVAFHSDRGCSEDELFGSGFLGFGMLANLPSPCFEIYSMNADGTGVTRLTDNNTADWNADWRRSDPPPPPVVTAAAPPPPPAPAAKKPARPSARVAGVRARGCTASRRMRVPIRVTAEAGVRRVQVYLDGRRVKTTSKSRFTVFVNARKLKSGRHRVTVKVTDRAGQTRRTTRRFSRCAQRQRRAAPRFTG